MFPKGAKPLLTSLAVLGAVCWITFANSPQRNPSDDHREVVSNWCNNNLRLIADIVEASDRFISEPKEEKERGNALIKSYEAWHEFWLQPEIDSWEMTRADYKLMQKSKDEIIAANARCRKEIRRRSGDHRFTDSEEIYETIRRLQRTNPLAEDVEGSKQGLP